MVETRRPPTPRHHPGGVVALEAVPGLGMDVAFGARMRHSPSLARLLVLTILSSAGCTSVHKGAYAYPIDFYGHLASSPSTQSGLVIRGRELNDLSSRYFGALEVTFENPTSRWVRIRRVVLDFRDRAKNDAVQVTLGEDIQSWAQATLQRNAVRKTNTAIALGALAAGGAMTRSLARKSAVGNVGAVVELAAVAALAAEATSEAVSSAEDVPLHPAYHLYAVPISVPPNLFTKRWIVLNDNGRVDIGCLRGVAMDYETEAGLVDHVWIAFRSGRSEWRADACRNRTSSNAVPTAPRY